MCHLSCSISAVAHRFRYVSRPPLAHYAEFEPKVLLHAHKTFEDFINYVYEIQMSTFGQS